MIPTLLHDGHIVSEVQRFYNEDMLFCMLEKEKVDKSSLLIAIIYLVE